MHIEFQIEKNNREIGSKQKGSSLGIWDLNFLVL